MLETTILGFDEATFRNQTASAVALRPQIEAVVDRLQEHGFANLFLIGAGGTYAAMWPYEHLARRSSTLPVRSVIAAELIESGDATLGADSVAIFTSVSGTTDDSLRAIEYCKARGVTTIGFTGYRESPIAQATLAERELVLRIHERRGGGLVT